MNRLLIVLLLLLIPAPAPAAEASPAPVAVFSIEGAIGPASADYFVRGLETAAEEDLSLVVLRLDTPGGLDTSMRDMIKAILASPVPVAVWVGPEGARAASAGTYILYAAHVAAMAPATNLGAATPVNIGGGAAAPQQEENPEDNDEPSGTAMERKAVNDAVAYIRGLAEMRGRNADWAEQAVREAVSLSSSEALDTNVIDLVARDTGHLLEQIHGREVRLASGSITLDTRNATVEYRDADWRTNFLGVITNPTVAYLLMLIGIYGLLFEGYSPGAVVPGVVGAICLLLALFAFQVLPVNYAGLGLIALGIALMVAEAFAPSFGALGLGGVAAFVVGSIILMDTDTIGFELPLTVIGTVSALGGLMTLALIWFAVSSKRRPIVSGGEGLVGQTAVALDDFDDRGLVHVAGENWTAETIRPVANGQRVRVIAREGLVLKVEPLNNSKENET